MGRKKTILQTTVDNTLQQHSRAIVYLIWSRMTQAVAGRDPPGQGQSPISHCQRWCCCSREEGYSFSFATDAATTECPCLVAVTTSARAAMVVCSELIWYWVTRVHLISALGGWKHAGLLVNKYDDAIRHDQNKSRCKNQSNTQQHYFTVFLEPFLLAWTIVVNIVHVVGTNSSMDFADKP